MTTEQAGKTTPDNDPHAFLRGLAKLVGFLLLVVVGAVFACSAIGAGGGAVSDTEVRNQCREWARDQLQAPSTGDFTGEAVTSGGENRWTVTGAIDAENGFGATVRATYTCEIRLDGDTWRGSARVNG